jgi:hypothetical protein
LDAGDFVMVDLIPVVTPEFAQQIARITTNRAWLKKRSVTGKAENRG